MKILDGNSPLWGLLVCSKVGWDLGLAGNGSLARHSQSLLKTVNTVSSAGLKTALEQNSFYADFSPYKNSAGISATLGNSVYLVGEGRR